MNDPQAGRPHRPATGQVRSQLAQDLLQGADQISEFMFGDPKKRRTVYNLAEKARLPVFRLGSVLCARKSVLMRWIEEQEAAATEPTSTSEG